MKKKQALKRPPPEVSVLSKARTLFLSSELAFPRIPEELGARLQELEPWVFSTRPLPASPYEIRQFVEEVRSGVVDDYAVLAHAGHGVNSYALHYYLVRGTLALFLQLGWGGVYSDDVRDREHIRQCFLMVGKLLKATGKTVPAKRMAGSDRLLVVGSDLYGSEWCPPRGTPKMVGSGGGTEYVAGVLRAAIKFVKEGGLRVRRTRDHRQRLRNHAAAKALKHWRSLLRRVRARRPLAAKYESRILAGSHRSRARVAREFYSASHLAALAALSRDAVIDQLSVWLEDAIDAALEGCSPEDILTQKERREQEDFIGKLVRSHYVVKVEHYQPIGGPLVEGYPDEKVAYSDLYEMSASGVSIGGTMSLCKATGEPFSRRDSRTTFFGMEKEFQGNAAGDGDDDVWMFERIEDSGDDRVIRVTVKQR